MELFRHPSFDNHEAVLFASEAESGLQSIIAIHNTSRGPALGGCRYWQYATEDEALKDVLRLARGMTYKAAIAELPLGGGKTVILADPERRKDPGLFRALGRKIEMLGGRYITAEDVGTSPADMVEVRKETRYVAGIPPEQGGRGDPSPITAYGVYLGLCETVRHALKRDNLRGLTVAVQGLGHVGFNLCRHLNQAGAQLIVADLNAERIRRAEEAFGARPVGLVEILTVEADVLSPNALGAVLNAETIPRLKVAAIAGAANNQLADIERDGALLVRRSIAYAPDYVINAGGLTVVCGEYLGWTADEISRRVDAIGPRLADILREASARGEPTQVVADRKAERLFAASHGSRV
ncbi:Glu/Leu/Phe/Val family dehydrogenase [Rhodoligotrophos ferricapiens]|uniref:Glu/Leu/Phe/Val family dehydrogenase n=1 Tax=Rhodoligotrophos ferricapiens TaxID=3069264 RepID=UPI00315CCAC1